MARIVCIMAGVATVLLLTVSAFAAPSFINFQGVLNKTDGTPVDPGSYDVTFNIYDALSLGNIVWGPESHTIDIVNAGRFQVKLGSNTPNINSAFDGSNRWLGMTVNTDPEMSPRSQISSVPYAMLAATVEDKAIGQDKLADKAVGQGQLADKAVGQGQINDKAVGQGQLGDKAVGQGQLNDKAVGQGQLDDKAVGQGQLGDKAVGQGQINDKAVGQGQLADHAVGLGQLEDGLITSLAWGLTGNSGTTKLINFLGTTDLVGFEIHVNNERIVRYEPAAPTPNITGGHEENSINNGYGCFIGGGGYAMSPNRIDDGSYGAIVGGTGNTIQSGVLNSFIGGGARNEVTGDLSVIVGGTFNKASGDYATISGGNNDTAFGAFSTIPGGRNNKAMGKYSFAAGAAAKANHHGSIVMAASIPESGPIGELAPSDSVASSNEEQFIVRADGGIYLTKESGVPPIFGTKFINTSTGAFLSNSGVWTNVSDRNKKENFMDITEEDILNHVEQLPITQWNYKIEDEETKHIGPMAQDFYAQFRLGADSTSIGAVDADGVALAAIKALARQNRELKAQVDELREKLEGLLNQQLGSAGE